MEYARRDRGRLLSAPLISYTLRPAAQESAPQLQGESAVVNLNVPTYYNLPTPSLVSLGLSNIKPVWKFGFTADIGATERTIWDGAANTNANVPASSLQLNVSSGDAADTAAGTGARTVQLHGLDVDYKEKNEIITMDGITPVLTTNNYLRMNRMMVLTAGSGGENAGPIYAYTGGNSSGVPTDNNLIYSIISVGRNQTLQCNYTIPADRTGMLYEMGVSSFGNASAAATVRLVARPQGAVWQTKNQFIITLNSWTVRFIASPLAMPAKSDLEVRAVRSSGAQDIDISAYMDLWLVPTS